MSSRFERHIVLVCRCTSTCADQSRSFKDITIYIDVSAIIFRVRRLNRIWQSRGSDGYYLSSAGTLKLHGYYWAGTIWNFSMIRRRGGRDENSLGQVPPPRITVYVIPWPNDQIFGVLHGFPGAGTRWLRSLQFMHRFPLLSIVRPDLYVASDKINAIRSYRNLNLSWPNKKLSSSSSVSTVHPHNAAQYNRLIWRLKLSHILQYRHFVFIINFFL